MRHTTRSWTGSLATLALALGTAGCAAGSRSAAPPRPPTNARTTPAAQATAPAGSAPGADARAIGPRPGPPAPGSAVAMRLTVARRFADAYMTYQIGRLSPGVRHTIEQTCTRAFARLLLEHPARLAPSLLAHPHDIEVFRVAGVYPERHGQVLVTDVSEQLSSDTGSFLLSLTRHRGRWLVCALHA